MRFKLEEDDMTDKKETIEHPTGQLGWVLYDKDGNVKAEGLTMNQVQTAHKSKIADNMDSAPGVTPYAFMWVGSGALGGVGATDLTTPIAGGRQAVTSSVAVAAVVTTIATFAAGVGTGTLTEIGMFITNAGADMMCGATIGVTKGASDSLVATWAVTFT